MLNESCLDCGLQCHPQHIVGHGRCDIDLNLAHWMDEPRPTRVERDAAVGITARRTVLQVALDGQADVAELASDLMVAARKELHFEQGVTLGRGDDAVVQTCLLALLLRGVAHGIGQRVVGVAAVLLFVAHNPMRQVGLDENAIGHKTRVAAIVVTLHRPRNRHDGPIGLVDLSVGEHPVHALQCLARLGKDDRARGGAVEAVRHAQKDIARLLVALLDEAFQGLGQWFVARLVGLHDFVARLRHDDEVVVFVDYLHRK